MWPVLAYDADGNVIASLDHKVEFDRAGNVIGLRDFEAHELAGGSHTDYFRAEGAAGYGTWPEWLGGAGHAFRVELTGSRITALLHRGSGHRRERHQIEHAIATTPIVNKVRDIRHIVGGPQHPLPLDEHGRTAKRHGRVGAPSLIGQTG